MVRWTLDVPDDLDADVRSLLAKRGGDLTDYVNETVRRRLLKQTITDIREISSDLSAEQAQALADEAVDGSRANRS